MSAALASPLPTPARQTRPRLPVFATIRRACRLFMQAPGAFLLLALPGLVPCWIQNSLAQAGKVPSLNAVVASWIAVTCAGLLIGALFSPAQSIMAARLASGEQMSIGAALAFGGRRYRSALGAGILSTLALIVGAMALLIPAVIVAFALALVQPTVALTELRPVAVLKRSAALTKGSRGRIFLVLANTSAPVSLVYGGWAPTTWVSFACWAAVGVVSSSVTMIAMVVIYLSLSDTRSSDFSIPQ